MFGRSLMGLSLLTATFAVAPLTHAADPLVTMSNPDLESTRERFAASVYGRIWNDQQLAPLRARITEWAAELAAEIGTDPLPLLLQTTSAHFELGTPVDGDDPAIAVEISGADVVDTLHASMSGEVDAGVAGTVTDRPAMTRIDDALILAANGATLDRFPVNTSDHDLTITWHKQAIMDLVRANANPWDLDGVTMMEQFFPEGSFYARFIPAGAQQILELKQPPAGLAPVDQAILQHIPIDAFAVYAIGIDGSAWWQAHEQTLFPLFVNNAPFGDGDAAAVQQQIETILQGFGIQNGIAGLAAGLNGTAVAFISQGGIVPSITIGLPRTTVLDQLLQLGLGMSGATVPLEGQTTFLVLRGLGPDGYDLAPGLMLGRDQQHWWISTDAVMLAEMVEGQPGGWLQTEAAQAALAAADDTSSIIGATDTRTLLRSLVPLAAFGGALPDRGRHTQAIGQAALRLAREAKPDIFIAGPHGDQRWRLTTEGTSVGLSYLFAGQTALIAAIAVPDMVD